jgi:hypothetical protein
MKIGIIKFGLALHEEKSFEGNSGFFLEVMNLIKIFEKKGDEVFIISTIQRNSTLKKYNGEDLDFIFVFNGPLAFWNWNTPEHKTLNMFERYVGPWIKFLNESTVPWIYIQPDYRYPITKPKDLTSQPKEVITLKGDDNFCGLDKLYLLDREQTINPKKEIDLGLMFNDTGKKRTDMIKKTIKWVEIVNKEITIDVKGKFNEEMKYNTGTVPEKSYYDYWKKVKYTLNMANESDQITPRIWDCFLNDTVSFLYNFDSGYKIVPKGHFLRVIDEIDLEDKIALLEKNKMSLDEILEYQRSLIKKEYLNGDFIYEVLKNKIKKYGESI